MAEVEQPSFLALPKSAATFVGTRASESGGAYSLKRQAGLAALFTVEPAGKSINTLPTGLAFRVPRVESAWRVVRYASIFTYLLFAGLEPVTGTSFTSTLCTSDADEFPTADSEPTATSAAVIMTLRKKTPP
jgi:hypothetical protein